MPLCVFDLDHTLIRSPLDLAAMALDMRALCEQAWGPLPPREERYRVGDLIALCERHAPSLLPHLWAVALDHERRALLSASLEPGARAALAGARDAGWATAVWTNNARAITAEVLDRFDLRPLLDVVVTRDDMRALKPDPAGWEVLQARFGAGPAVVVGDSWVDGVAATAAGVPFVAYRADGAELARRGVRPVAWLDDLAALPGWLKRHG
ncbi:MAG: HAD hydrolase-like protein [Candidatus Rokubacteria bacterium]|nr:HAD hydrolase-like protein [Candidatus Rokubacteria bacterium]